MRGQDNVPTWNLEDNVQTKCQTNKTERNLNKCPSVCLKLWLWLRFRASNSARIVSHTCSKQELGGFKQLLNKLWWVSFLKKKEKKRECVWESTLKVCSTVAAWARAAAEDTANTRISQEPGMIPSCDLQGRSKHSVMICCCLHFHSDACKWNSQQQLA